MLFSKDSSVSYLFVAAVLFLFNLNNRYYSGIQNSGVRITEYFQTINRSLTDY